MLAGEAQAARKSDIRSTKHNLSSSGTGTMKATGVDAEDEVCVFCHTPHAANTSVPSPLWNRTLNTTTTYNATNTYTSSSIEDSVRNDLLSGPGGSSKLCLSCHDGTLAVGSVGVLGGQQGASINMTSTYMPDGSGAGTGFTRNLGTDLSNDHPISFTYNATVASDDGELREPPFSTGGATIVGNRTQGGTKPSLPLDNNQMQCSTCHDPHLFDPAPVEGTGVSIKFLRLNRFQTASPSGQNFTPSSDIICLACHNKGKSNWSSSAHAVSTIADEKYKNTGTPNPTTLREFKTDIKVWEAACLNCHDSHTVSGARKLLREGTDASGNPKAGGGKPATEETCYQCHTTSGASIVTTGATAYDVPDIKTDITTSGNKHMPISNTDQNLGSNKEWHDIRDADFTETQASLGKSDATKRHAECPDCHNPHRVMKNQKFDGTGATSSGTHFHATSTTVGHSNLASGVLRGAWGVEPVYGNGTAWLTLPSSYDVKQGDGTTTTRSSLHVTREYQVCLKCHSDYAYTDNNTYPDGNRPAIAWCTNCTSWTADYATAQRYADYTNQAMELAAAANDAGTGDDQQERAASTGKPWPNHRSWHPVMWPTGRSLSQRGSMANIWTDPWNANSGGFIGSLTMFCSDCHGTPTANGVSAPVDPAPWGPHGSSKNFILKGDWNDNTGEGQSDDLCFKCHNYDNYAIKNGSKSGFGGSRDGNLHGYHSDGKIDTNLKCNFCHIAVPHGWKNKALLVNLNEVCQEAGQACGAISSLPYDKGPYYRRAYNKVKNWQKSGSWSDSDCGPPSGTAGKDWMLNVCQNPCPTLILYYYPEKSSRLARIF